MTTALEPFPIRACNLCGERSPRPRFEIGRYHIVRCSACGFQYVAEEITPQELTNYYGEAYYTGGQEKGYADYLGRREARKAHFRSLLPSLRHYLTTSRPRVLDVGCAAGFFLEVVREQGWQGCGVELSPYAAEYARSTLGLEVLTGTLADVGLPEGSFDLVTLWDVIEHLRDPFDALVRSHRLMRADGLIVVSTGDVSGATARIYGRRWALLAPPGHLFYFSRKTLYAMLERAGFRPLSWQSDGAFLLNESGAEGCGSLRSPVVRLHHNRWVNALLRRLKLGSIVTVYARRCSG